MAGGLAARVVAGGSDPRDDVPCLEAQNMAQTAAKPTNTPPSCRQRTVMRLERFIAVTVNTLPSFMLPAVGYIRRNLTHHEQDACHRFLRSSAFCPLPLFIVTPHDLHGNFIKVDWQVTWAAVKKF